MKKDIRDYLHLYFKCWGTVTESKSDMYEDGQWALSSGLLEAVMIGAAKFTPHLRPLSSMTEEEKVSLALIFGWVSGDNTTKINHIDTLFEQNGFFNKSTNLTGHQWNDAINFLRSNGIDCDGLIDAGLALDITKQPAQ